MIEDMSKRSDYSFTKLDRILKRKKVDLLTFDKLLLPLNL